METEGALRARVDAAKFLTPRQREVLITVVIPKMLRWHDPSPTRRADRQLVLQGIIKAIRVGNLPLARATVGIINNYDQYDIAIMMFATLTRYDPVSYADIVSRNALF